MFADGALSNVATQRTDRFQLMLGRRLKAGTLVLLISLAAGLGAQPAGSQEEGDQVHEFSRPLKIYIYKLPEEYTNATAWGDVTISDYGLDQLFPQLLKASPYVTTNPEEADYFYVDAWIFWPHAEVDLLPIVENLRSQGPWFDRKKGADHIFVISADQGRCQYEQYEELLSQSIYLLHYGGGLHYSGELFSSRLQSTWGGNLDRLMMAQEAARSDVRCSSGEDDVLKCTRNAKGERVPFMCHVPYQDIVVPPPVLETVVDHQCHHCGYNPDNENTAMTHSTPFINESLSKYATLEGRNGFQLLFSGPVFNGPVYSMGVRQTLWTMFKHREQELNWGLFDMHVGSDYWNHLFSSVFCAAVSGTGWGSRFKVALTRGCIPLIMHDGIAAEFEEQLPLKDYTVRVPMYMMFRLPRYLNDFRDTGFAHKLFNNLKCAWRLHWWRRPHGRAFEVVMCELKLRAHGLRGKGHMSIDYERCVLKCGPQEVPLLEGPNNVSQ